MVSPIAKARDVLKEYKITKIPVDVEKICKKLSIKVYFADFTKVEEKAERRISGLIQKRKENDFIILVNENDMYTYRSRFTIAHELGHYYLHMDNADDKLITSFRMDRSPRETEANRFAAELLMPEPLVRKEYEKMVIPVSDSLAEKFKVSKQAMRVRLDSLELMYV